MLALLDRQAPDAVKFTVQVISDIGIDALYIVLALPMQASVANVDDTGLAPGLLVSFRLFGALLDLAMCSTIFSSKFVAGVAQLHDLPEALASLSNVSEAVGFIPSLRTIDVSNAMSDNVLDVYAKTMRTI